MSPRQPFHDMVDRIKHMMVDSDTTGEHHAQKNVCMPVMELLGEFAVHDEDHMDMQAQAALRQAAIRDVSASLEQISSLHNVTTADLLTVPVPTSAAADVTEAESTATATALSMPPRPLRHSSRSTSSRSDLPRQMYLLERHLQERRKVRARILARHACRPSGSRHRDLPSYPEYEARVLETMGVPVVSQLATVRSATLGRSPYDAAMAGMHSIAAATSASSTTVTENTTDEDDYVILTPVPDSDNEDEDEDDDGDDEDDEDDDGIYVAHPVQILY